MSYRDRFEEVIHAITAYPLCEVVSPASFGDPLPRAEIDTLAERSGLPVPEDVRRLYEEMDGVSFFWRARSSLSSDSIEAYNCAGSHPTAIGWEEVHGFSIVRLAELLTHSAFGELWVEPRPDELVAGLAGSVVAPQVLATHTRPFDRHLSRGSEDGCVALLMLPGQDARVVGISDSGMVDPRRPWMSLADYLDYMLAMCGDQGGRYEFSGRDSSLSPGRLRFDPESLASFRRGILRTLP